MAKYGRISMTTEDGAFNFTPDKYSNGKYKYVTVRIYHNPSKADTDFYLKDNTSDLDPLPKCEFVNNFDEVYKRQFKFAINKLDEIYRNNPDAFWRYDDKKKRKIIDTRRLTKLVYDDKAKSKSRNGIEFLPITEETLELSTMTVKAKVVDQKPFEKEKIRKAKEVNEYLGAENTTTNIIKEIKRREVFDDRNNRNKKYGDYAVIVDTKKIKEILSEGEFDLSDLYLLSCAITNQEKNAKKFSSLLHRFREYNLRNKTTLRIKDLTVEGIQKFVLFFTDNGVIDFSTIGMTPFNYRSEKFIARMKENGVPLEPTDETWRKFFIYLKLLLQLLNDDEQLKSGWKSDGLQRLKQINELCDEENYGIVYSSLSTNTRQNYHLTKDEFDAIFKLKLKDATEIRKHPISGHNYTVGHTKEELTLTRDMFVTMCWLGGLRPIEYKPEKVSVLKDAKGEYYVNFITSEKNKKEVANPVLNYSFDMLKKYKFNIPYAKIDSLEFKMRLKVILQQAKIDRVIDKIESRGGKDKKLKVNIQDAIYPYFARHTFMQILDDAGLTREQRAMFTGHGVPNLPIDAYSTKKLSEKKRLIKDIKAD